MMHHRNHWRLAVGAASLCALAFPARADLFITTKIGNPFWQPTGLSLFSAPIDDGSGNYQVYVQTIQKILPSPYWVFNPNNGQLGPGSAEVVNPNEIINGVVANHYKTGSVFTTTDYTSGNGVILSFLLLPTAGAPTGLSPDSSNGPIIPNALYPMTQTGLTTRNGSSFDPNWDFSFLDINDVLAGLGRPTYAGFSRMPFFEAEALDFGPGNVSADGFYNMTFHLRDTANNGWDVSTSYIVAVSAVWNGSSGNWSDASRWSTSPSFPNNTASTPFIASIPTGTVTLDTNIQLSVLALGQSGDSFTSSLNLANNKLVIQATDTLDKAARIPALATALKSGSNNGTWTGPGITSAAAASNAAHFGVGLFDNAVLGLATFGNISVDANSLLISLAHLGDANFSGIIDIQDQSIVTNHWQSAQQTWSAGDLNLDGIVDLQDLTLVTNNWQQSGAISLDSSQQVQLSGDIAVVPEPASVIPLVLSGVALLARRKAAKRKLPAGV